MKEVIDRKEQRRIITSTLHVKETKRQVSSHAIYIEVMEVLIISLSI